MAQRENLQINSTSTPSNHFFGFHDLVAFNKMGDKILCLESEVINRPPLQGEKIAVGYADTTTGEFFSLGETNAFNYPQGARQQWLNNDEFIVNNQVGKVWGSDIYDSISKKKIESYESTAHCISKDGNKAFGLDYERIHRLGGYGYIGIEDACKNEQTPTNQGIWIIDLHSKDKKLLISIKEIAEFENRTSSSSGFHHYLTHLVLNPSSSRIAFLHRFFLPDGGIRTRLMTIGTSGTDLRCLAVGFLSHFDWRDDNNIFIWGRAGGGIDQLRSNPLFSNPLVAPLLRLAKKTTRKVLNRVSTQLNMSFLLIEDSLRSNIRTVAEGVLTEDGHPMFSPADRDFVITDNYPDENNERTLILYKFSDNTKAELGKYRMLDIQPDTTLYSNFSRGVDKKILELISPEQYSFTRSGLHCDLHPRWNADGTKVAFDSIHEGSRQLYWIDLKEITR